MTTCRFVDLTINRLSRKAARLALFALWMTLPFASQALSVLSAAAPTCTCLGPSEVTDFGADRLIQVSVAGSAKRISSRFSLHRKNPLLGIVMPHLGTDIAAPTGAPVFAAGDGTIQHAATSLIYGNYLLVRYSAGCASRYAHLSRFGKGIHKGSLVKRGEPIGFVGSSGRSTGSHLHYEFYWRGERIDPLCTCPATPQQSLTKPPAMRTAKRHASVRHFKHTKGAL